MDVAYVQRQKSKRGANENIQQLCVAEKRETSSVWNSVETSCEEAGAVCLSGQESWWCPGRKW